MTARDAVVTIPEGETTNVLSFTVQEYAALLEQEYKITLLPPDLDTTAEDNMLACRIYDCMDPLLVLGRQRSNDITALFNALPSSDPSTDSTLEEQQEQQQVLEHKRQALLFLLTRGKLGRGCKIHSPIQVDYGHNMTLGDQVVWGSNVVTLDCAPISIGDRTIFGPGVKLFGATHPLNPLLRYPVRQFDFAMEIHIGKDCWLGGSPARVVEVMDREECEAEGRLLEAFLKADKEQESEVAEVDGFESESVKIEEFFDQWRPPVVETMVLP
ncbi:hypothetical protein BGZ47_005219 [Haplosporangium gracile]|nr:hypothetical protein BGZ47_005219 [Haplosporangium gracile]